MKMLFISPRALMASVVALLTICDAASSQEGTPPPVSEMPSERDGPKNTGPGTSRRTRLPEGKVDRAMTGKKSPGKASDPKIGSPL